jgi:hypothetical protein
MSQVVASSSSAITFPSVTGYRRYKISYSGVVFSATGTTTPALIQFSSNGGSSYVSSGYQWNLQFAYATSGWGTLSNASDTAVQYPFYGISTTDGVGGEIFLYNFNSSSLYKTVSSFFSGFNTGDTPSSSVTTGNLNSATAMNALQITPGSGTFTAGTFTLWGSAY